MTRTRTRALDFVTLPLGVPGSGAQRYAAAMSLYQERLILETTLEVFRICAPDDRLDPIAELRRLGLIEDIALLTGHGTIT
jgi:hypothetical protein